MMVLRRGCARAEANPEPPKKRPESSTSTAADVTDRAFTTLVGDGLTGPADDTS